MARWDQSTLQVRTLKKTVDVWEEVRWDMCAIDQGAHVFRRPADAPISVFRRRREIHAGHYVCDRNVSRRTGKRQKRFTSTEHSVGSQTRKTHHRQDVAMRKHRRDDHCGPFLHTGIEQGMTSTKVMGDDCYCHTESASSSVLLHSVRMRYRKMVFQL